MSNLNTEAYLRAKGLIQDTVITRDLPCRECGYNLRGLEYGGKCPECGTRIDRKKPIHDHLMDAPRSYLNVLRIGMGCVAAAFWAPIAAMVLGAMMGGAFAAMVGLVLLGGGVLFVAGGWIVTRPKPHEQTMSRPWHHPAHLTRGVIILTPVLYVLTAFMPAGAPTVICGVIATLATYAQLALLAWVFSEIADWARDESVGRSFDALMSTFVIFAVVELVMRFFGLGIGDLLCIGPLFVVGSILWFFISALRLFGTVNQAFKDKARHDGSIFRNPAKEIH